MKNLKKTLALVLSFAMVFGVAATAAVTSYPDVPANATYAEAVNVLSAIGIIQGDDEGKFNPDQSVTRAEMSKILYAMVSTGVAGSAATSFKDVAADHWASGYIQGSKQLGFIDGYDANTFGPEDDVTYEQVLKLVLCAMGYRPAADAAGGFPTGYLMVAADIGLSKGLTKITGPESAPRSVVANVVYNGINLPIMKQTSYGKDVEYVPMDGSSQANYVFTTLLNKTYGAYKVEGKVMGNSKTALNGSSTDQKSGYVRFEVTNTLKVDPVDLNHYGDQPSQQNPIIMTSIYAGETGAENLLGFESVAYLRSSDDSDFEIISIVSKANRNIVTSIAKAAQIYDASKDKSVSDSDKFDLGGANKKLVYSYWKDRDSDSRITVVEVDPNAYVIWNGEAKGRINAAGSTDITVAPEMLVPYSGNNYKNNFVRPLIGSVDLIDVNNDGRVDIINSKAYSVGLVKSVNAKSKKITIGSARTGDLTASIILDDYDNPDLKEYSITKDGKAIDLSEIQENDVINVCSNDYVNPTFYEIIVTRNPVTGKVTEADSASGKYAINGAMYAITAGTQLKLAVSSEGVFYLDMDGNIFSMDTSISAGDYAYLIKMGGTDFEDIQMKLFSDQGIKVVDVADKVKINGVAKPKLDTPYTREDINNIFGKSSLYTEFTDNLTQEVTIADVAVVTGGQSGGYLSTESFTPALLLQALTRSTYTSKNAPILNDKLRKAMTGYSEANGFVSYNADSSGILKEIDLPVYHPTTQAYFNFVYPAYADQADIDFIPEQTWKETFSKFGNKVVSADAKVFMINGDSSDEYQIRDTSALVDGKAYQPLLFGNTDSEATAVLLLNDSVQFDSSSALAIFDSATRGTDDNDDEVTYIRAYQGGSKLADPLMVDTAADVTRNGAPASLSDIKLGDTFVYATDSKGYVTKIYVIFTPGQDAPAFDGTTDFDRYLDVSKLPDWNIYSEDDDTESQVYFGYLAKFLATKKTVYTMDVYDGTGSSATAQSFSVGVDVPVTKFSPADASITAKRIKGGLTIEDVDTSDFTDFDDGSINFAESNAKDMRYVFVRLADQEVVEVIYISYF